jgi:hypothetical protein
VGLEEFKGQKADIGSRNYEHTQMALRDCDRGYTACIEDEHGRGVDEESLKIGKAEPTKPTLYERVTGALVFMAAAVAAIGTLYLIGLWVDH